MKIRNGQEDTGIGGFDPYSSSKGCAELVILAYLQSFFPPQQYPSHGSVRRTVLWYKTFYAGASPQDILECTTQQIKEYMKDLHLPEVPVSTHSTYHSRKFG